MILLNAAAGTASGALTNVGINDHFIKKLCATLVAGSSSLFVLVRHAKLDKVLEELQGTGGRILKTSLSHEDESKLQAALECGKIVESSWRGENYIVMPGRLRGLCDRYFLAGQGIVHSD